MCVLRVIGAIETKNVTRVAKHLLFECTINDGPNGDVHHYLLRHRGHDTFRCVSEFYSHANDARTYQVEISLHPDSEIDLLCHNVGLHDVLAECAKRAGKTRSILSPPAVLTAKWGQDAEVKLAHARRGEWAAVLTEGQVKEIVVPLRALHPGTTDEELLGLWRRERDDAIWNSLPHLNTNLTGILAGRINLGLRKCRAYGPYNDQATAELQRRGLQPAPYVLDREWPAP